MARRIVSDTASGYSLRLCHLYPDLMDTYGDRGNISSIVKRCEWRGIQVEVTGVSLGQKLTECDIYFFGGGQDKNQVIVGVDLKKKANQLKAEVEAGCVLLSICGGYQLLQHYFKTHEGFEIAGIGLFDAYTQASGDRMIQNLLIKINPHLQRSVDDSYPSTVNRELSTELIGFENHSGKTFLQGLSQPLGRVEKGAGNNGQDKTEGIIYKNAFGCYLHGSLLPKNPHFADLLIEKALERKYGKIKLEPLDDYAEWEAHKQAVKIARK